MTADSEEQKDELLALQSIFSSEEFGRNESNVGGEIRVDVEVPAGFSVAVKEGKATKVTLLNVCIFWKSPSGHSFKNNIQL